MAFRGTSTNSDDFSSITENSKDFRIIPKCSEEIQRIPHNFWELWRISKNSIGHRRISNFLKYPKIRRKPENSKPVIPKDVQKMLEKSEELRIEDFWRFLRNSEKKTGSFRRIPRNFRRSRKKSKSFQRVPNTSKKNERSRIIPKIFGGIQKVPKNPRNSRKFEIIRFLTDFRLFPENP